MYDSCETRRKRISRLCKARLGSVASRPTVDTAKKTAEPNQRLSDQTDPSDPADEPDRTQGIPVLYGSLWFQSNWNLVISYLRGLPGSTGAGGCDFGCLGG